MCYNIPMNKTKHQLSAIKLHASKTPEERSAHATKMAQARWDKTSKEKRTEHARMMLKARYAKKK
uniref:Uncharacterized protein n=1 Tax=uncultured marine virus TaxID=186617 RepID=A0A0F7L9K7_9VIRU|nr:hypothetical protein [uncultured marine virus]